MAFSLLDLERVIAQLRRRLRLLELQGTSGGIMQTGLAADRPSSVSPSSGSTVPYYAYDTQVLSVWNTLNESWDTISSLTPSTDLTTDSTSFTVNQSSHGFVVGDIVRSSGVANTFTKAQADSAAHAEVAGCVSSVINANSFVLTTQGLVTAGVPAEAAGSILFLSPSTAGALTTTEPSSSGEISKPLAIVVQSANKMLFINFRGEVL